MQTSVHLLNWGLYRSTSSRYNVSDRLVGFSRSPESYNMEIELLKPRNSPHTRYEYLKFKQAKHNNLFRNLKSLNIEQTSKTINVVVDGSHGNCRPLRFHCFKHVPGVSGRFVTFKRGETRVSVPSSRHVYCLLGKPSGKRVNLRSLLLLVKKYRFLGHS